MTRTMIQVGTGGMGNAWCRSILPPEVANGTVEVVAAVDVQEAALVNAQEGLGLRPEQCYTDIERAFSEHRADFCTVVVPPKFHESVVDAALRHGMNILSEKPIADTLEGSCRIAAKVARAGAKMGVTMSHRFDQDKETLRRELRSPRTGDVDYLVGRFVDDCRAYGAWGAFRHDIIDPLMIEGAVHHLDILADLAGANCDTLYAQTWNPRWGAYAGDSQGLVLMHFENGTRATYEGATTSAVQLNGWSEEYVRAECEHATLVMDHRRVERLDPVVGQKRTKVREGGGETLPLLERDGWAHRWLVQQFVAWLDGGPAMATNVEDNLQSVALIFAAIESSRTGQSIKVQEFLAAAKERAVAQC
ncbi:MAG: Gfo/Idh/MocA family oxidoreductase [Thermomicrobiales bacterium]